MIYGLIELKRRKEREKKKEKKEKKEGGGGLGWGWGHNFLVIHTILKVFRENYTGEEH